MRNLQGILFLFKKCWTDLVNVFSSGFFFLRLLRQVNTTGFLLAGSDQDLGNLSCGLGSKPGESSLWPRLKTWGLLLAASAQDLGTPPCGLSSRPPESSLRSWLKTSRVLFTVLAQDLQSLSCGLGSRPREPSLRLWLKTSGVLLAALDQDLGVLAGFAEDLQRPPCCLGSRPTSFFPEDNDDPSKPLPLVPISHLFDCFLKSLKRRRKLPKETYLMLPYFRFDYTLLSTERILIIDKLFPNYWNFWSGWEMYSFSFSFSWTSLLLNEKDDIHVKFLYLLDYVFQHHDKSR